MKVKKHLKEFVYVIVWISLLMILVTTAIQAFSCPQMTSTELFLHIPKSYIGDIKHCD